MKKDIVEMSTEEIVNNKKSKDRKSKIFRNVITIVAIAYTIMPADLLPDVIPVIGTADDAGVWIFTISMYIKEIKEKKEKIENLVTDLKGLME